MKIYTLIRQQFLPVSLNEAWDFFSNPKNLSVITPPDMQFHVLTSLNGSPIYTGMVIDYTLRPMLHIPVRWQTLIKDVDAPHQFVDTQSRGPYSLWEHTHTFVEQQGGVLMTDTVRYALPLGILGRLMHRLTVHKRLLHIFNFRYRKLEELFVHKH